MRRCSNPEVCAEFVNHRAGIQQVFTDVEKWATAEIKVGKEPDE